MDKVYLETTIPSYLTARGSRDIVTSAQQQVTREWFQENQSRYELFISEAVLEECRAGNPEAANRRLQSIKGLPTLKISDDVIDLARIYHNILAIPEKAKVDSLHLAITVIHEIDFMLTWNCKHLAHGEIRKRIHHYNLSSGLFEPIILTPLELMRRD